MDIWICQACKKEHTDYQKAEQCHPPINWQKCKKCGSLSGSLASANEHDWLCWKKQEKCNAQKS
jgi:hypothetical protein